MKKTLITTVAVLLGMAAAAQDSIPYLSVFGQEISSWHIARFIRSVDQGGASTAVLTSFTDSSLQTAAWHPVLLGSDTALSLMESSDHSRLFLRYPSDTTAHLLMDLNLQTGDTLPVHFRNGSDTMAIVDSVYFSDGVKHLRTTLALSFSGYVGVRTPDDTTLGNTPSEVSVPLTLIEGIGPNWGLDYGRENLDTILAVSPLLLCHHRDSLRDYHQQVDTDYPRPDGSDNDPCSLEYIRYKSTVVPGTEWYETFFSHSSGSGTRGLVIDSILVPIGVDSVLYHVIKYNDYTRRNLYHECYFIPVRYLRESKDHSRIYGTFGKWGEDGSDLTDEIPLMNLNLNIGDTFDFQDYNFHYYEPPRAYAIVDSVYYQTGLKHIRFAYFLDSDHEQMEIGIEGPGNYFKQHISFEFIESIGITWGYSHLVYTSSSIIMTRLMCVFRNEQLIYCPLKMWSNISDCIHCTDSPGINDVNILFAGIHPNPVSDILSIDNLPTGQKTIIIQDATGREWMKLYNFGQSAQINLSHLPRQIYFLSVLHESGVFTQKIIKQ